MGRRLRIFEPGSYYHLTSRGSDGQAIVRDDLDRLDFLRWLSRIVFSERWRLLTYCLIRLYTGLRKRQISPMLRGQAGWVGQPAR